MAEKTDEYTLKYGNIAKQSLGAISRALTALEAAGGELFFGEPALDIRAKSRACSMLPFKHPLYSSVFSAISSILQLP